MSKFVLKQTADGMHHLYLDDPNVDGFQKISHAKNVKIYKDNTHIVLSDGITKVKTLFGLQNNKVFQATLPEEARIEFINGLHCIFERNDQWYTMEFNCDKCHERLLGKRHISYPTYEVGTAGYVSAWNYFLKNTSNGYELSHIVNGQTITLGTYLKIEKGNESHLIATKDKGEYDVFTENSTKPLKNEEGEIFDALDGVFVWIASKQKWIFHANCSPYGKNAVYRILGQKYGKHVELYRIDGEQLHLVASGHWYWQDKPFGLCIDGMCYIKDFNTYLINLDNPRPTIAKRIKNFFKLK